MQTWIDNKSRKRAAEEAGRPTGETLTGSRAMKDAIDWHEEGHAIGVALTEGKSRKADDIKRVLGLMFDLDSGLPKSWPLPPTAVVKTSEGIDPATGEVREKFQAAFMLAADEVVDADVARAFQVRIAMAIGADMRAVKLAQPMRLAGSLHRKEAPQRVMMTGHGCGARYKLAQLEEAFPAEPHTKPTVSERAIAAADRRRERNASMGRTAAMIEEIIERIDTTDRETWRNVVSAIHHETGGSACGFVLARRASDKSFGSIATNVELQTMWRSLGKGGGKHVTMGTLMHEYAKAGGDKADLGRRHPERGSDDLPDVRSPAEQLKGKTMRENIRLATALYVGLSPIERAVLEVLCAHHNGFNNGRIRISMRRIAFLSGASADAVRRATKSLEQKALIQVTKRGCMDATGGKMNAYEVCEFGTGPRPAGSTEYPVPPKLNWATQPLADDTPLRELAADRKRLQGKVADVKADRKKSRAKSKKGRPPRQK
jgi:hypothetical protein